MEALDEFLDCLAVLRVGGADEEIIGSVDPFRESPEFLNHLIGMLERRDSTLACCPGGRVAVFIGSCKKKYLVSELAMIPGEYIRGNRGVSMADMWNIIDVVNGGGYVKSVQKAHKGGFLWIRLILTACLMESKKRALAMDGLFPKVITCPWELAMMDHRKTSLNASDVFGNSSQGSMVLTELPLSPQGFKLSPACLRASGKFYAVLTEGKRLIFLPRIMIAAMSNVVTSGTIELRNGSSFPSTGFS